MSTQIQTVAGSYWHTTLTLDEVVTATQMGPWLHLPLVERSHSAPFRVVLAREHVASMQELADE